MSILGGRQKKLAFLGDMSPNKSSFFLIDALPKASKVFTALIEIEAYTSSPALSVRVLVRIVLLIALKRISGFWAC